MKVLLAQPRGFCAGVVRAINTVELALDVHAPPVYVYHEIVHNRFVVESLEQRGAVFVNQIADIPPGSVAILSAHGVSNAVVQEAQTRDLQIIDATCPLVTKVHLQAQKFSVKGFTLVIVGHLGHEEVDGTMGSIDGPVHVLSTVEEVNALQVSDPDKVAYVTQTTLSIDDTREVIAALTKRFPTIEGPGLSDICYATQNRQNAVHDLARQVDLLLVVGAQNSSNSNRLREVGEQCDIRSYLVQNESDLNPAWFTGIACVGITAGASTPEVLVQRVVDKLYQYGADSVQTIDGVEESTHFRLPDALREFETLRLREIE